ncbi:unnamed protein product [Timema podura]|uniref:Uncharacterized protein n=1 Tax=Timema podura TaxID=61482 RepID=A0ABN7PJL2_TIMPD|nr:unnamed protein product [Timema podura]
MMPLKRSMLAFQPYDVLRMTFHSGDASDSSGLKQSIDVTGKTQQSILERGGQREGRGKPTANQRARERGHVTKSSQTASRSKVNGQIVLKRPPSSSTPN